MKNICYGQEPFSRSASASTLIDNSGGRILSNPSRLGKAASPAHTRVATYDLLMFKTLTASKRCV